VVAAAAGGLFCCAGMNCLLWAGVAPCKLLLVALPRGCSMYKYTCSKQKMAEFAHVMNEIQIRA
jgi:hypothetical protein